jgi:hypothetical protein
MTNLTLTEGLGSQMYHFASLYAISKFTGHSICFFEENNSIGKGLLINKKYFPNLPLLTPRICDLSNEDLTVNLYPISKEVAIDTNLFTIDSDKNYNFTGLFHTYKMWMPILNEINHIYSPSDLILNESIKNIFEYKITQKKLVSVHVRRGDYLDPINSFFTQLNRSYFDNAISHFNSDSCEFIVFSDDIEWCKENFSHYKGFHYSEGCSPLIDLFTMSLCDHNIISNSSFSMWAAILNKNADKKIICPAKYFRNDASVPFFNYNWFPDNFTPVFIGND